jgi:hypothetical protein
MVISRAIAEDRPIGKVAKEFLTGRSGRRRLENLLKNAPSLSP